MKVNKMKFFLENLISIILTIGVIVIFRIPKIQKNNHTLLIFLFILYIIINIIFFILKKKDLWPGKNLPKTSKVNSLVRTLLLLVLGYIVVRTEINFAYNSIIFILAILLFVSGIKDKYKRTFS